MKRIQLMLAGGIVSMALGGCASVMLTEQAAHQAAPPTVENVSLDVSKAGADVGTLVVQVRQPSYQMAVERYAIKIDSNAALVVPKQSDVTIKLNAGSHTLKFYATSSNPADSEKATFGDSSTKNVVITKSQDVKLKYTGPIRLLGAGNIEDVK